MPDFAGLDQASLESFVTDLIEAGFEPVAGSDRTKWEGPCPPFLADLTAATTMQILIRPGWPFRHPYVFISGLQTEHVNASGVACLWAEDDNTRHWLTLDGLFARLAAWARAAANGFGDQDVALDAYLAFDRTPIGIATFNSDQLLRRALQRGSWGRLHATTADHGGIHLQSGTGSRGSVGGMWFYIAELSPPPQDLVSIRHKLTPNQKSRFDSLMLAASTAARMVCLVGEYHGHRDAIVLRIGPEEPTGNLEFQVFEPAMTDTDVLLLRCGPDADVLSDKRAVIFGVGAIGSHVAALLAECGLGFERLIDGELLRPGNVVRHAASSLGVGYKKTAATQAEIGLRAPWARVEQVPSDMWDPGEIAEKIADVDVVVDATGRAPFTEQLSRLAVSNEVFFVSVALYREGSVGRVRRFRPGHDVPIHDRADDGRFPIIPAGDLNPTPTLELGCSAPVNNASPVSVVAVASAAVGAVIDGLKGRFAQQSEIVDVYRHLDQRHPFDVAGRYFYD